MGDGTVDARALPSGDGAGPQALLVFESCPVDSMAWQMLLSKSTWEQPWQRE